MKSSYIIITLILFLSLPLWANQDLRFEAEDWSTPHSAWQVNKHSDKAWNLWSTDTDAHKKWSEGVVLQSPKVLEDRSSPSDGAPVLHTRITGIPLGKYDISIKVSRTLALSLDGQTWQPFTGGLFLMDHVITDGTFEVWVDDRYVHKQNPGSGYYDYLTFSPVPEILLKPKVKGAVTKRVQEKLDRGFVALPTPQGVCLSWRLLKEDPQNQAFVIKRRVGDLPMQILHKISMSESTFFLDKDVPRNTVLEYVVEPVSGGERSCTTVKTKEIHNYVSVPLPGVDRFQKLGLGDLNGDGALDFVIKHPHDNIDPYEKYWKPSPNTYELVAVTHDGSHLWTKDLGWAIERGIWYSPYLVYDFDGDGKAEVAAKIGAGDPRDRDGRVRSGSEWLVVWDGKTGKERARVPWPDREAFGGNYNRASRNQLAVAYLDGKTPCLIALRGTYDVMLAEAYELVDNSLRSLWRYSTLESGSRYQGQGAHFTHCVDLDEDGRDEVILGSVVLDDNGTPLWNTRLGHPDHVYCGDLDPDRSGLEIYYGIEKARPNNGMCLVEAHTGNIIWGWNQRTHHIHSKGMCADLDPTHRGCEFYSCDSLPVTKKPGERFLWNSQGKRLNQSHDFGFGVFTAYWDADLQKELIQGSRISKFNGPKLNDVEGRVVQVVDLLGDWREELIVSHPGELRIYTTTIPVTNRRVTLLQDPIYRLDTAMNAMGYTQNAMLSYFLE